MIEYAFVLVISTNPLVDEFKYYGDFASCQEAHLWMSLHVPEKKSSKCLHQDYIYLPENTIRRKIDMRTGTTRYFNKHYINICQLRRNCDG